MPIWSYVCEEILKRAWRSHETEKRACSANGVGIFGKRSRYIAIRFEIRTINKLNGVYIRILREKLTFFTNAIDKSR